MTEMDIKEIISLYKTMPVKELLGSLLPGKPYISDASFIEKQPFKGLSETSLLMRAKVNFQKTIVQIKFDLGYEKTPELDQEMSSYYCYFKETNGEDVSVYQMTILLGIPKEIK